MKPAQVQVVLRADASKTLGTGHVMRCLSLANECSNRGGIAIFVCLDLPEHLNTLLVQAGHSVVYLPSEVRDDEEADAKTTLALAAPNASFAVLDHYALGLTWEHMVNQVVPVLALDDLGRAHKTRWLLDQNFYNEPLARYTGLSTDTKALLGPNYALLRPEFAIAHHQAQVRTQGIRTAMVFLGGMDADNITGLCLEAISQALPEHVHVHVVASAAHPVLDALKAWCDHRPHAQLHVNVQNMAQLMLEADLGIGAGGSSTWERCAAGLPTIAICLAENQREVIREGAQAGFLWGIEQIPSTAELAEIIRVLYKFPAMLACMSRRAMQITDGRGTLRVAELLMPQSVQVRQAHLNDAQAIYNWRTAPSVQKTSRSNQFFSFEAHCEWMKKTLNNPARILLIGVNQHMDIGVVRFDIEGNRAEVSIFLHPELTGCSLGKPLLIAAEQYLQATRPEVHWLDAWVQQGNEASIHMFNRLGYQTKISRLEKEIA